MLRQLLPWSPARAPVTAAVVLSVGLAPIAGCKARQTAAADIRSAEGAESGETPRIGSAGDATAWLLDQLERDLAATEVQVVLAGAPSDYDVQGLALSDGSIDERENMLRLARQLEEYAADRVIANRHEVEAMAEELKGLADLLSGLSDADRRRAASAIARVRAILDSPPQAVVSGQGGTQGGQSAQGGVDQQVQSTQARQGGEVGPGGEGQLRCLRLTNGSFLPAVGDRRIGVASQQGGLGFTQLANCELVVREARNGIVCSIARSTNISPHVIATGTPIGPEIGFAQTANCAAAVTASDDFICLVDNRPEVRKYAKYEVASGRVLDYWFDDHERCRRGDKSPSAQRLCLDRCRQDYDRCHARAQRLTGMDQTSARIDCLHQRLVVCEPRCG